MFVLTLSENVITFIGGMVMAINSYMISELFPNTVAQKLTSSRYKFPIKYATIYNPLLRIKEDAVYLVVNPREFPEEKSSVKSTFLILGRLQEEILEQTEHDVICLSRDSALGKIYETLLEHIEKYERWENSLNRILLDGGSVEDICRVSLPFFDNPMFVVSNDLKVLAVEQNKLRPFAQKVRGKNGYLCEARVLSLLSGSSTVKKFEGGYFNITAENNVATLRMTIVSNQQVCGYVCMDDVVRPFSDGDYTRLCMMQPYILRCITLSPNVQSSAFHRAKSFLSEYLFSENPNSFELRTVISSLEWKNNDSYICCVLHIRSRQESLYMGNYLCGYIEHCHSDVITVQKDETIYILCNLSHMKTDEEKWLSFMRKITSDYGVSVGVGSVFSDSSKIRDYFRQAKAALSFCTESNYPNGIYRFDEYRLQYILRKGLDALPLYTLLTPQLHSFLQEDAENQYENYKILRCYIRNNLNVSETSAELFLHRSSLNYRLDKIKKMLDSDLTDKDEQLYFRLLFYAIDRLILQDSVGDCDVMPDSEMHKAV